MAQQYRRLKSQHPDKILFFRLGDFYEMFYEDAQVAARELDITLTSRETGKGVRVPMAGVPHHAAEGYLARLLERGHRVAICEQVEDPRTTRGLLRREVVRVVTPGTFTEPRALEERANTYLAALAEAGGTLGLSAADLSTGEFSTAQFSGPDALEAALEELVRLEPRECLAPPSLQEEPRLARTLGERLRGAMLTPRQQWDFDLDTAYRALTEHFGTLSLRAYGCEDLPAAVSAAGGLLAYVRETQRSGLEHMSRLVTVHAGEHMYLDATTRRNLELCRRLGDGAREGTLLWVLDSTVTSMGGRLLRHWVEQPLVDLGRIRLRQDAVAEVVDKAFLRSDLRQALSCVRDLERLVGRASLGTATARDLWGLRQSLEALPRVREVLGDAQSARLQALAGEVEVEPLQELAGLLARALVDDPPVAVNEGGMIRPGYSAELDGLRAAAQEGKGWIAALETRERERTGIKSLKVGYNRVFGYYLEVTNPHRRLIPADYVRKQTLANCERFITPQLKEKEETVLGAQERAVPLEYELLCQLRQRVTSRTPEIQAAARAAAELDALASLAECALRHGYARPQVESGDEVEVEDGRHPVLEVALGPGGFVPNSCRLDREDHRVLIVTGPNMAGKSTFLRQVALIVLLAQMGGFVPARSARVGLVDRIFTRVGATDDLVRGQSTFMAEMTEVANILHHATARSLLILDEIGRGTSTFDGLSIAWAVTEYIHDPERVGCKALLATHYHELCRLEDELPGVKNYSVAVQERGDDVVFLRKIVRGGSDRSYGIHVARLAGLPPEVVHRAREVLLCLESVDGADRRAAAGSSGPGEAVADRQPPAEGEQRTGSRRRAAREAAAAGRGGPLRGRLPGAELPYRQLAFFEPSAHPVLQELEALNILHLTPLEALNLLHRLKEKLGKPRSGGGGAARPGEGGGEP